MRLSNSVLSNSVFHFFSHTNHSTKITPVIMFRGNFQRFIDRMVKYRVDSISARRRNAAFQSEEVSPIGSWIFAAGSLVGLTALFSTTNCIGNSMSPTIDRAGDMVLTDKLKHLIVGLPYEVGEVVIAVSPSNKDKSKSPLFSFSLSV